MATDMTEHESCVRTLEAQRAETARLEALLAQLKSGEIYSEGQSVALGHMVAPLHEQLAACRGALEAARTALEFYADEGNWSNHKGVTYMTAEARGGLRAREVLANLKGAA